MDADLKALEQKLSQLISLCGELRHENAQLRHHMSVMESDAAALRENMAKASERVEALIETLP